MKKVNVNGLWKNADFMKFWTGETLSMFGTQLTAIALPILAAVTLNANAMQMGVLNAAQFAPYLFVTLFAGVFIDRHRRLPIMIHAHLGRAVLLGLIPLSFFFGFLKMEYLYIIAFLVGCLNVLFDVSYQSYLPSLVDRKNVEEGNTKLEISRSVSQVAGPGLGGILISLLSAPLVILLDAVSFLVSAITFSFIRKKETIKKKVQWHQSVFVDIKAGLSIVYKNTYLRAISFEAATYNLFSQVTWAVMVLYLTRNLNFSPQLIGFILAVSSVGSLVGSFLSPYIVKVFKTGPTILGTMILACASPILVPLAVGPQFVVVPIIVISFFLAGIGLVVSNVHVISLRQSITPEHLLGRMNASYRFVVTGTAPLGALLRRMVRYDDWPSYDFNCRSSWNNFCVNVGVFLSCT
ncbi:MFS transporter [Longirhabdus pacifica]|uniref:MFS transporter n=1 Tax=Longirhabdus pacifica TaxID=2305227 RepID=UPI0010088035|nr:MFS transporter [Longirhabdus pacifica]